MEHISNDLLESKVIAFVRWRNSFGATKSSTFGLACRFLCRLVPRPQLAAGGADRIYILAPTVSKKRYDTGEEGAGGIIYPLFFAASYVSSAILKIG